MANECRTSYYRTTTHIPSSRISLQGCAKSAQFLGPGLGFRRSGKTLTERAVPRGAGAFVPGGPVISSSGAEQHSTPERQPVYMDLWSYTYIYQRLILSRRLLVLKALLFLCSIYLKLSSLWSVAHEAFFLPQAVPRCARCNTMGFSGREMLLLLLPFPPDTFICRIPRCGGAPSSPP